MAIPAPKHITDPQRTIDNLLQQIGADQLVSELIFRGVPMPTINEAEDCSMESLLYEYREQIRTLSTESTRNTYTSELSQFARFVEGRGLLQTNVTVGLTPRILGDYLASKKLKPTTRNKKVSFLRTLWKYALYNKWVSKEIPDILKTEPVDRDVPRALSEESIAELLELCKTLRYAARYYCLVAMMLATGARIGEIATLRIRDVDWAGNTSIVFGKNHPKGRKLYQGQEMTTFLLDFIQCRFGLGETGHLLPENQDKYVFSAKDSGLTKPNIGTIQETFKGLVSKMTTVSADMKEHLTPHSLRHTFATTGRMHGVDLYTLSRLLGHRHVSTTEIYLSISDRQLQDAAAKMQGDLIPKRRR